MALRVAQFHWTPLRSPSCALSAVVFGESEAEFVRDTDVVRAVGTFEDVGEPRCHIYCGTLTALRRSLIRVLPRMTRHGDHRTGHARNGSSSRPSPRPCKEWLVITTIAPAMQGMACHDEHRAGHAGMACHDEHRAGDARNGSSSRPSRRPCKEWLVITTIAPAMQGMACHDEHRGGDARNGGPARIRTWDQGIMSPLL